MRPAPSERLLHALWLYGAFETHALRTVEGLPVRVVRLGRPNPDQGPDIEGAELFIGEQRWAGALEFHWRSADWVRHGHHQDPRYNAVILHLIWRADPCTGALYRADGSRLPELVLQPLAPASLRTLEHPDLERIPYCKPELARLRPEEARRILDTLQRARLLDKTARFRRDSERLRTRQIASWDEALWRALAEALGYSANREPMRLLAERVPLERLRSLPDRISREALLFGVAGWLPDPEQARLDAYAQAVRAAWEHLADLPEPIPGTLWRTARVRPANHPVPRIAQAAALAERLLEAPFAPRLQQAAQQGLPALRRLLQTPVSAYWQEHRTWGVRLRQPSRLGLGRERLDVLLVNAVLPALCALREEAQPLDWFARLLALYRSVPLRGYNRISRRFAHSPLSAQTEADAQALQHLFGRFCSEGGCLHCPVGTALYGF
ncbi:MAG: DUF2851 family protein [Bacteroidetes bacterium]|nr:DUF2851 family protein [Rhodothermia bacterium]MCS7155968.1 DUF2851 family protein [Bacteroidota bacterium]MCX7907656.1 DUF2851 family protein [Bacteroidota bacterium]MDW8137785.1 DUF2851 family protein [Bacteroidota bacterium]MDW8286364.1 DUF2851 family protein [Bacteroidota bacterium]